MTDIPFEYVSIYDVAMVLRVPLGSKTEQIQTLTPNICIGCGLGEVTTRFWWCVRGQRSVFALLRLERGCFGLKTTEDESHISILHWLAHLCPWMQLDCTMNPQLCTSTSFLCPQFIVLSMYLFAIQIVNVSTSESQNCNWVYKCKWICKWATKLQIDLQVDFTIQISVKQSNFGAASGTCNHAWKLNSHFTL